MPKLGLAGLLIVVSLMGGLLLMLFSLALQQMFTFEEQKIFNNEVISGIFYFRTVLCLCWSLLYFGIKQMREGAERDLRLAEAESSRQRAELQMLRAQMNPHFLFNALNTIRAELGKPGNNLKNVVQALAEYLRYSIEHRNDDLVEIGTEFDAVVGYLTVEKARFREELAIDCQIDETARTATVPGIFLQPLVENAIKYGRQTSEIPLKISVRVFPPKSGRIRMEVSNTGRWMEPDPRRKLGGVGLSNLRQRLALIYPGRHSFGTAEENGWVTASIEIPFSPTK
jgi:LytS/YehU family sensor histidine kinase